MDEFEGLQDWEILETTSMIDPSPSTIIHSESLIQSDYFNISKLPSADSVTDDKLQIGSEEGDHGEVMGFAQTSENQEDVEEENSGNSDEILLESKGDASEMESLGGELVAGDIEQTRDDEVVEDGSAAGGGGDEGRSVTVWWKVPVELLKFCVFRVSPVWTFSIAAAVMGLILLKRRLSRMSRKSRSIPIKLTVEDKRVSQVRAAGLNEAFSVARHVPIVGPLLPSSGMSPWPMLNMR